MTNYVPKLKYKFCHNLALTHHNAKKRAIELHLQGWHPADIAMNLGVSLRSIQRWISSIKDNGINSSESKTFKEVTTNSEAVVESQSVTNSSELAGSLYYPSKSWVSFAQGLADEHFVIHSKLRGIITSLLESQLQNPENLRGVHTLSMAVTRHLEGERQATSLHLLDVNRAVELLHSHGFFVSPMPSKNDD